MVIIIIPILYESYIMNLKGGLYPSHFTFEINVGKRRIRHRTTVNLNSINFNRFFYSVSDSLFMSNHKWTRKWSEFMSTKNHLFRVSFDEAIILVDKNLDHGP